MKTSIVVLGFAVLVAVLVKSGEATSSLSRDEMLDEFTEQLLVRYLDRRNIERNVQDTDTQGLYDNIPYQSIKARGTYNNGPVRRWWGGGYSSNTNNAQTASNTGNINGNTINGGLSAGSIIGSSQGRK